MGYTHGRKWSEDLIEKEIKNLMSIYEFNYLPSRKEMIELYGNSSLSVAISKYGGLKYWSKRLGIPVKECESSFGNKFENIAIKEIERHSGLKAVYTNSRYPYDILVDDSVKVDVKASKLYHKTKYANVGCFNLEKKLQTCDVFIFYCLDDNGNAYKRLIIPSTTLSGQCQIGIGQQSKWNMYIDRWDIIVSHADFFRQFKEKPKELNIKKQLSPPVAHDAYV